MDDPKQLLRSHNPRLQITVGTAPGQVIIRDGFFGEGENYDKGWITKRYAHFLETVAVERK